MLLQFQVNELIRTLRLRIDNCLVEAEELSDDSERSEASSPSFSPSPVKISPVKPCSVKISPVKTPKLVKAEPERELTFEEMDAAEEDTFFDDDTEFVPLPAPRRKHPPQPVVKKLDDSTTSKLYQPRQVTSMQYLPHLFDQIRQMSKKK